MKRCLCLLMTLALLLCALCSCSGNIEVDPTSSNDPDPQSKETDISYESENPNSSDLSDDTSSGEASDISEESTTSDEPGINVVIYDDLERYYSDSLNDIYLLSKIRTWDEIYAWNDNVYLKQPLSEISQLPPIYQAIKGLNVNRDEFTRVNAEWIAFNEEHGTEQSTYTDEQIEYMFGDYDENEIKQKLKQVTTYYYEGRLYTVYELMEADADLFNEMIESGGLEEFAVSIEKYVQGNDLADVRRLQKRIHGEDITDE